MTTTFEDDALAAVKSLLSHVGLYAHHLSSFENLVSSLIPRIVSENSPLTITDSKNVIVHRVHFLNPRTERPCQEDSPGVYKGLRGRDLHAPKFTLLSSVIIDLQHDVFRIQDNDPSRAILIKRNLNTNVLLFQLPVMDASDLTHDFDDLDGVNRDRYGSSFVVNGHRKTIIVQSRLRTNFPFVKNLRKIARYSYVCEIRSAHRLKLRSSSTLRIYLTREKSGITPRIMVEVPYLPHKMPVTVLFRLLGVASLAGMLSLITGSVEDYSSISRARAILQGCVGITDMECDSLVVSKEDLLVWVAEKLNGAAATGSVMTLGNRSRAAHISSMTKLISSEILPHLGSDDSDDINRGKAAFVGVAINRLLNVSHGTLKPDDIDDCLHRRFSTAGQTLAIKIRQLLRNHCKMLSASITRNVENNKHVSVLDLMKPENITKPLRSCLAKGNFSVSQTETSTQAGVSQVVNSMNRVSRIGHLTTLNTPMSRSGSQSAARQLRPSSWGIVCSAHTPDGRSIGLVTHHTVLADFRNGHNGDALATLVKRLPGIVALSARGDIVIVNDEAVARTANSSELVVLLRRLRKHHVLPKDVSISHDVSLAQVTIQSEEGDAIRPILRVDGLQQLHAIVATYGKFQLHHVYPQLLAAGVIEYVNKAEEATLRVASMWSQLQSEPVGTFTHIEFDPTIAMFGAVIGLVPFSNHNQGPRNVYFGSMCVQAIGAQHPMFDKYQVDTQSHVLQYPQKSLVRTVTSQLVEGEEQYESIVQLYNVAVLPADGLNQEDAIVGNRHSFQRGLANSMKFSTMRDVEGHHAKDTEYFGIPPQDQPIMNRKEASVQALDVITGLPRKGAIVNPGDIVIGKLLSCCSSNPNVEGSIKSIRKLIDRSSIWRGNGPATIDSVEVVNRGGNRSIVVRLREFQSPEVGDKFSSLASQKGVLGALINSEDMPFTPEGIVPDILFAAHGLSSRMTIGQLREMVGNQLACIDGKTFNGTSFQVIPRDEIDTAVREDRLGMHHFTCGKTGNYIGKGFMCLASYMLQRHKVDGKVHARAKGPVNSITGQAVEGRAHNGGLKLGTMEISTIASTGAISTLTEAMSSHDGRKVIVCGCGRLCGELSVCSKCNEPPKTIFIPRITLVLYWELAASGIEMRFIPNATNSFELAV